MQSQISNNIEANSNAKQHPHSSLDTFRAGKNGRLSPENIHRKIYLSGSLFLLNLLLFDLLPNEHHDFRTTTTQNYQHILSHDTDLNASFRKVNSEETPSD
jgi:hypothetical protein